MALDLAGDGSLREVAQLPFYLDWDSPAIMYDTGKILLNDFDTGLWTIDITTAVPEVVKVATLPQQKNYGNMTVLADGRVLFNGGSGQGNLEAHAEKIAYVWDPETGALSAVPPEAQPRLYHSTTILLADGSIASLGGGSASIAENDYLDGQIFRPDYLFNADGSAATRPVISGAPASVMPGDEFRLTVDDATAIERLTFAKTGAVTHNINMDARFTELHFHVVDAHTIEVHLPGDAQAITAGSWMLFAWNTAGVPSIAPIIAVEPTLAPFDGIGDLAAEYLAISAGTTSLDQIDFAAADDRQLVDRVDAAASGAVAERGPVAARYQGMVHVEAAGTYTFHLSAGDGVRLYVDGRLVIDGDRVRSATELTASIALAGGHRAIELRWFATDGSAAIDLDWSGAGFARRQLTFDGMADNLLVNGGFERAGGADDWLPGWTASGTLDSRSDGGERSGNAYAAIGAGTGALTQTVATVKGAAYAFSIDVQGALEVVVNGVVLATIQSADTGWQRHDVGFTGTGRDTIMLRVPAGGTALVDTALLTGPAPELPDDDHHGNHIMGTDAADTLRGTGGPDHVMGMAGADVLIGRGGADTLDGGDGADRLTGGRGRDVLIGGAGADRFVFAEGDSRRGALRDVVKDFARGEDRIVLDGATDFIGRNGFTRTASEVRIGTVDGVAVVQLDRDGNGRADLEIAVPGVPTLAASDFADLAVVDRRLTGTAGNDRLVGLDGDDTLVGLGGNDLLDGGAGIDTADYSASRRDLRVNLAVLTPQRTGEGTNRLLNIENLTGGRGADRLDGDGKANRLVGGSGDDVLFGSGGADVLVGGNGDDRLSGGTGADRLTGGGGRDTFVVNMGGSVAGARDVITDFAQGQDVITGNLAASGWIGTRAFTGRAGEVGYGFEAEQTIVRFDADGDRVADLEIALAGRIALKHTDFLNLPNAAWATGVALDQIEPVVLSHLAGWRTDPVSADLL